MMPVLVFDIETIPDIDGLRKLHGLDADIADKDVADMAFQLRRQSSGNDFLPLHLQRVVTIACALRDRDTFRVWSFGEPEDTEASLIQRFFDGIERYAPQIVSWNGGGFDLPVLHYRGLIHGVRAARYWDLGDDDRDFKWNNYISRYHMRHLDLMDLLALYQPRAAVRLDQIAQLIGFPGKLGMDGSQVWDAYQAGKIAEIRHYCETDVVNTYLVYLRFQMMRGALTGERYDAECAVVRTSLGKSGESHWQEFLGHWKA
ncbi:MAG TPA: 3'-5' exonuclease [Burkholderiales bacterium]|jgi:predicted PolB exonuclease-like 3'-5' exonuclease|nr:3'-5' exonuclease [Burkholderiales bacterium]